MEDNKMKKKIMITVLCLAVLTGCGKKENNLLEVSEANDALFEQYEKTLSNLRSHCYNYDEDNSSKDFYEKCTGGIDSLIKKIDAVDDLMKKNSNDELVASWNEKKKKADTVLPDLKKYYSIVYSLQLGNTNVSSLSDKEYEKLKEKFYGKSIIYEDLKDVIKIDWLENTINMVHAEASNQLKLDEFNEEIVDACLKDNSVTCRQEVE